MGRESSRTPRKSQDYFGTISNFEVDTDYNFFFTASEEAAKGYGNVMPVFLNISNPEIRMVRVESDRGDSHGLHEEIVEAHDFGSSEETRKGAEFGRADGLIMTGVRFDKASEQEIVDAFRERTKPDYQRIAELERELASVREEFGKKEEESLSNVAKEVRSRLGVSEEVAKDIARVMFKPGENPATSDLYKRIGAISQQIDNTRIDLDAHLAKELRSAKSEMEDAADLFAVDSPSQIKSADLATFDDAGNLIPLSRRFDRTKDDIRYSGARSAGALASDLSTLPEATRRAVGAIRHVLPNVRFHAVADADALRRAAAQLRGEDGRDAATGRRTAAPAGRQKDAGVAYPDAATEIQGLRLAVGKSRREQYRGVLAKRRPDLDAEAVLAQLDKFDDPKKEKLALHWVVRGSIDLAEDAYKVDEALAFLEQGQRDLSGAREVIAKHDETVRVAKEHLDEQRRGGDAVKIQRAEQRLSNAEQRFKDAQRLLRNTEGIRIDPFLYDSPDELLLAHKEFKLAGERIDPSTVPELSDPRDEGDGIVSYLVQDDRQGQAAMRRIIDTHWGEDANPWCLLARSDGKTTTEDFREWARMEGIPVGHWADAIDEYERNTGNNAWRAKNFEESLRDSWSWWRHYSALPKRAAFKNGRLLAFMATELGTPTRATEEGLRQQYADGIITERELNWGLERLRNPSSSEEWWDRKDESHPGLDWARDATPAGIRESRKASPRHPAEIAKRGTALQPTDEASNREPVQVDPGAGQRLASLAESLAQNGERNPEIFLHRLIKALGNITNRNPDHSEYFVTSPNGVQARMRLADHSGNAHMFGRRGELTGNTGVVVKLSDHRFVGSNDVEYREFVFFPERLTKGKEAAIARGLADWAETGHYTGPEGDQTNVSPRNFVDAQGRTVGAFDKATNTVFLTPEATAGTVRHEVLGHALWQRAKQASGDAYGKFREIAAAAPKEIADFVRENYPDLEIGSEAWEDELFAHAVEKKATGIAAEVEKFGKLHPVRAWWNRVVQAIGNVWRALTGQDAFKKYRMLKPAAALDSIIRDAMNGRSFGPLEAEEGGGTRQSMIGRRGAERLGIGKLDAAERMEKEGASREDIWKKTGWWRGKDGKWRVELPISTSNAIDIVSAAEQVVAGRNDGSAVGKVSLGEAFDRLREVSEADPKYFRPKDVAQILKLETAYPEIRDVVLDLFANIRDGALGQYRGAFLRGEARTISIADRAWRQFSTPGSVLLHELQHFIQTREGFQRGAPVSDEYYRQWVGEVEARNVERRGNMKAKDLKATPPWATEDVPESEQAIENNIGRATFEDQRPSAMAEGDRVPFETPDFEFTKNDRAVVLAEARKRFAPRGDGSEVKTDRVGVFSHAHFAVVSRNGNIESVLPILGNESIINRIQEDIKNGTYKSTAGAYRDLEGIRDGFRRDNRNRVDAPQERTGDRGTGVLGLRDQGDGQRRDFEKGVGTARRAPAGAADGQTGGTDSRRLTGESGAVNPEADALGTAMFSGARSAEALLDDRLRARTDERGGIVAFTGTAADYAQKNPKTGEIENPPSLAYVGTGTGGQLQGHGLYASGERAVGEHYADSAAGGFVSMDALGGAFEYDRDQRTLDWIKMPTQPVSQTVEDALVLLGQARGDVRRAIELGLKSEKDAREAYERWADEDFLRASGYNWQAEGAKQAVKWLRANGGSVKSTFAKDRDAYVYEQRMWPGKALEEINLIDYYGAPTDEDLANVRQIWGDLTNLPAEKLDRYIEFMRTQRDTQHGLKSTKWANIFKTGAKNLGIEPAQFAKALYDLGYHGTVYPLNGSATNASVAEKSGKGSTGWRENIGGYNYVAFNDADIEVRHKWRDGEQMYSGARSAAAIFGGTVRVRADGTMDYSLVADSLLRRTRMLQGMPNFQFASERRSLARVAEEAQALIAQDPEGAQDLVERAVSAFGSGQAFVPSDKELAVLYMEEVMREQRVLDAQEALRRVQDGLGDGTLSELDAQAALAQARADQLTFAQALSNAKSAQGRALGANRMMISDDYSFGGVVDEVVRRIRNSKRLGKAAANTPLSTAEAAQIEKLVKRVQDLADAKDAAEAALSEARAKVRALKAANTRLRDAKAERKRGLKAPKSRAEALEAARKSIAKALETGQVDLANYPELWAALNGPVKALADAMLREQVEAGTAGTHILRIQVCGNAQNRHCRRGTGPPAQNRHCRRGTGPPAPDWHCRRGTGPPAPDWHCRRGTGPPAPDWHCRPGTVAPARNRHCRRGTGPTVKKTALSEGFRTDYGPCYRL